MKKFAIFTIVFLVIFAVFVGILIIIEPQDVAITRSTIIKAPKNIVFNQIVHFKNWSNWSPYIKSDTSMKLTYTGIDGMQGSAFQWVGNEKITGSGEMKNELVTNNELDFVVNFTKPNPGSSKGILKAEDSAGGYTKVSWTCLIHWPKPLNALWFIAKDKMDKMNGDDFENGLDNLKRYCELHLLTNINIVETVYPAHLFQGYRKTVKMEDLDSFFADSYTKLGKGLNKKIAGSAVGLIYNWDTINKNADIAAAFPVADSQNAIKESFVVDMKNTKAYMAIQKGGYSNSKKTHEALNKYVTEHGKKQHLIIEEYNINKQNEPDSNKWVTTIYYLIE